MYDPSQWWKYPAKVVAGCAVFVVVAMWLFHEIIF
jgi:type VI protein secretion system component VasF